MSKHEIKNCPCCGAGFECKPGAIAHCQCYGIRLTAEEERVIAAQYNDCLCRNCLLQLRQRPHLFTEQKERYDNR